MLLTITLTQPPATDLGYLLHKNPEAVQQFELSFGLAHVFYPEVSPERCTAALLLDVDAVGLARGRRGPSGEGRMLRQYVNDRPYAASSFLSVAIGQVFGSALSGRSRERPELAKTPLPFEASLAVLPCRGGEELLQRLFQPLGYQVVARSQPLDDQQPEWGESPYFMVSLSGRVCLSDMLRHLTVLVPVLDNEKHYWVGDDEVEKLLRRGAGWLSNHPEKELITHRYLKHKRSLAEEALDRLAAEESVDPDREVEAHEIEEEAVEKPIRLNEQRLGAVLAAVKQSGAKRVLDLGCGQGMLLKAFLEDRSFTEIVGMDVSYRSLMVARDRLRLERLAPRQQERIRLIHGSLTYRDRRLEGYDAATVVEVIEHLDPPRLAAFECVLFEAARPKTVVITTPNAEFNVRFPTLPAGNYRHQDHRFEWSRSEFQAWASRTAERFGYTARFLPVGQEDPEVGSPTQMAVFDRG